MSRASNLPLKPPAVLICTQTFPPRLGGMEAVMHSLATLFSGNGYDVLVAADKAWDSPKPFGFFSVNVPRFMRSAIKRMMLGVKRFDPDLTICDSWKSVSAVPRKSGKLVVLAHGQEYLDPSNRKKRAISNALERADLVVASSAMTANLVRIVSPSANVEVIYPTYMLSRLGAVKAPYRASKQVPVILSICRIENRKGLFQSADALDRLLQKGLEFEWKIAGSGPDLQRLKDFLAEKSISSRATFLGRVSDPEKEQLLSEADLYLMPSYQAGKSLEGFGISYAEAAKFGVASIAGEVGGAPEAVLNGKTGWCVDGSKSEAIERALCEALSNSDKLQQLGHAAKNRFDDELAGEVSFKKLVSLCQLDISL